MKILEIYKKFRVARIKKTHSLPQSVSLGYPVFIRGNVEIGEGTYINAYSHILSGPDSKISIGKKCAISYNVMMRSQSHNPQDIHGTPVQRDIQIGDNVWIGANVFVREGIEIGDFAVVGANSVVTHDVPSHTIVGGVPARIIRNIDAPLKPDASIQGFTTAHLNGIHRI